MICNKCKFENISGTKFCGKCGGKLESICSKCNFTNPPDYQFCGSCGGNLATGANSVEINYSNPKTYTPAPIAEKILTVRKQVEGERKLVTVFFADVTNYTAMSEKFDPEEVHSIIEGWYKIVMERIYFYEGTITQFMGDGVMALFGAPIAHEDHARRACLSALSIQEEVKGYAEKVNKTYGIDFKMRVGLNSGPVIVGSIGDDLKMDYTAIGDTVNLASRMESSSKPGTVQASVHVYTLVKDFFEINHLGKIQEILRQRA